MASLAALGAQEVAAVRCARLHASSNRRQQAPPCRQALSALASCRGLPGCSCHLPPSHVALSGYHVSQVTAGTVSCSNWVVCLVVALKVDKTRHTFMQVRAAAAAGARLDGRGFLELPPIEVATGVASQALGSAHVVLGDTEVLVGVKVGLISLGAPCSGQCASQCNTFLTQVQANLLRIL